MKESNDKEGNITRVWTFEEWKAGISPPFFGLKDTISDADYQKLRLEQKRHYQEAINRAFEIRKKTWNGKLERTRDKAGLKSKEIAQLKSRITKPVYKNSGAVKVLYNYWKEYDELIIDGQDGSIKHYPYHNNVRPNSIKYIEVETIKKFLDFLTDSASKKPLSYQWRGDITNELPALYEQMSINRDLIEPNKFEKFKAIFAGQPLEAIEPLRWMGKPVLLAYFLKSLEINSKLRGEFDLWSIAENCFIGQTRKNLGQAYQNYLKNNKGKPLNHDVIDSLF